MHDICGKQIQRTSDFLKPHVELAVAYDFYHKDLINKTYINGIIGLHRSQLSPSKLDHDNFKFPDANTDIKDLPNARS